MDRPTTEKAGCCVVEVQAMVTKSRVTISAQMKKRTQICHKIWLPTYTRLDPIELRQC